MSRQLLYWLLLGGVAGLAALGCESDEASPLLSGGTKTETEGHSIAPGTSVPQSGAPEAELEENFRSPVVSGHHLWSANPETNRVARIDARDFEVQVIDGGHGPTFLAALPRGSGDPGALVLNVLGDDASVLLPSLDSSMGGAAAVDVSESRVPVQKGASAWAVGEQGRVAVAWSRFEEDLRGPLDGYQDLSIIDLTGKTPRSTRVSVGYRPTQVFISDDETRVFVVSDPGISVIDLQGDVPRIVRELFLPDEGLGQARDISFTPDGGLALVRLSRRAEILLIRTADDSRVSIDLPKEVTDLDLSGDGSVAIAVMRGDLPPGGVVEGPESSWGGQGGQGGSGGQPSPSDSLIGLFSVPEIFDLPTDFEILRTSELIGSTVISEHADSAVFYTSAVANSRLSILRMADRRLRVVDLQAPAQAAFLSEDGENAVAVMTPPTGSGKSGAFALVPVLHERPLRIEGTVTVPRFVSIHEDRALVTTWGSEVAPAAAFLGSFPELPVDRIELPSEPLAAGIIADARQGFVAQAHPEGRVTFVGLDDSAPTTVTGFELASKVVEK